ncbi:DNA polymerase III subunit alpha [Treponema pedis]|uniref:DNA polymerase III subunit alpha n=1 Tax=Treponema pedis TaxID=409322 RepID=UPI0004138BF4|nr:DNA polymerase III subunit alpha [Treponema pedis]
MESNFVHLHVHSDFSLLDGAASVKKLVAKAAELGQPALALTDHGNMFGAVVFYKACNEKGIKPIIGCEVYVAVGSRFEKKEAPNGKKYYHLILLAKNETGYRNLMLLCSKGFIEGMYYKPRIDEELLERHSEGLICLSACIAGELPVLLLNGETEKAEEHIRKYRKIFGAENYFIEIQDHGIKEEKRASKLLIETARRIGVPLVVTNDIHYAEKKDAEAQDILLCIGMKKLKDDTNRMKFEGEEFYFKSEEEMAALFPEYPEAMLNTVRIADMCNLKIPQPGPILPIYEIPEGFSSKEVYIRSLAEEGLKKRYAEITPEIKERLDYELGVVIKMDFVGYFLIVWDFINWAKNNNIPVGPGRGSGAGSILAYALRITDIDPLKYNLLFERFLNPERVSMPDFDVDFCFERRQEVIDYVRKKYGDENVGQIITFGTLKAKAVVKDVGRVLNVPLADVNAITKLIPDKPLSEDVKAVSLKYAIDIVPELKAMSEEQAYKELFEKSLVLEGSNRNTGLHAAGIVIGKTALTDYVPLYKDSKTGKVATQFTMDLIEDCGLVKMDFLGLKTLTLIKHTEALIHKRGGEWQSFSIENIDYSDKKTFEMLSEGKAAAVFQFESQGMQNILKRAKPNKMEDLIALNALYRPGPMDYINQFIESKFDHSKIKYPDPCLEDILSETYGVIVYQEQVMQVAQRIAGYTLGQADILRRAMGKKKIEVMKTEKEKFIAGALQKGFSKADADRIFEILIPFAGYGFNKSHAAAYSVLAFQTAYLKAHFPAEFMAANLTNEITTADKLPEYIAEAEKMGLKILPPDINQSDPYFSVSEDGNIVFGLMGIKGVGLQAATELSEERRKNGKYKSFLDFLERNDLHTQNKRCLEVMIKTGCFDGLGQVRSTLILNMEKAVAYAAQKKESSSTGQASLFEDSGIKEFSDFIFEPIEDFPQKEKLRLEKELMGFYISGHPLDEYRKVIENSETLNIAHLSRAISKKKYVLVGMLTGVRPYQTKKGKPMGFGTFEDLNGAIDLVFFSDTWEKSRAKLLPETVCGFSGTVDNSREGAASFLVDEVIDINSLQQKAISEVHIELDPNITLEQELVHLKDFLYERSGSCDVYIHTKEEGFDYIIKASPQLKVPATPDFAEELKVQFGVSQIWLE